MGVHACVRACMCAHIYMQFLCTYKRIQSCLIGHAPTYSLGHEAAAVLGVGHPVVVLEGVHRLEDRAHTADVVVDLGIIDELTRQVRIQLHLYLLPWQRTGE